MTKEALIARLETLLGDYQKRTREYTRQSGRREWSNPLDANRYEGIATASRWAAEDLAKLLNEAKR